MKATLTTMSDSTILIELETKISRLAQKSCDLAFTDGSMEGDPAYEIEMGIAQHVVDAVNLSHTYKMRLLLKCSKEGHSYTIFDSNTIYCSKCGIFSLLPRKTQDKIHE